MYQQQDQEQQQQYQQQQQANQGYYQQQNFGGPQGHYQDPNRFNQLNQGDNQFGNTEQSDFYQGPPRHKKYVVKVVSKNDDQDDQNDGDNNLLYESDLSGRGGQGGAPPRGRGRGYGDRGGRPNTGRGRGHYHNNNQYEGGNNQNAERYNRPKPERYQHGEQQYQHQQYDEPQYKPRGGAPSRGRGRARGGPPRNPDNYNSYRPKYQQDYQDNHYQPKQGDDRPFNQGGERKYVPKDRQYDYTNKDVDQIVADAGEHQQEGELTPPMREQDNYQPRERGGYRGQEYRSRPRGGRGGRPQYDHPNNKRLYEDRGEPRDFRNEEHGNRDNQFYENDQPHSAPYRGSRGRGGRGRGRGGEPPMRGGYHQDRQNNRDNDQDYYHKKPYNRREKRDAVDNEEEQKTGKFQKDEPHDYERREKRGDNYRGGKNRRGGRSHSNDRGDNLKRDYHNKHQRDNQNKEEEPKNMVASAAIDKHEYSEEEESGVTLDEYLANKKSAKVKAQVRETVGINDKNLQEDNTEKVHQETINQAIQNRDVYNPIKSSNADLLGFSQGFDDDATDKAYKTKPERFEKRDDYNNRGQGRDFGGDKPSRGGRGSRGGDRGRGDRGGRGSGRGDRGSRGRGRGGYKQQSNMMTGFDQADFPTL